MPLLTGWKDLVGAHSAHIVVGDIRWEALTGIPDINVGDSVWWHCDMIHAVAPVTDQKGWGNVMYVPAAPWCPRNEHNAATVQEALRTGRSPGDFPAEHYERAWCGRFTPEQLDETVKHGSPSTIDRPTSA